jgi:hypothetical protein
VAEKYAPASLSEPSWLLFSRLAIRSSIAASFSRSKGYDVGGPRRLMSRTEYDIERRLSLYVLLDEIRAAALKHCSSEVERLRYQMLLCIPMNELNVYDPWKDLDAAIRDVVYLSGEWLRGAKSVTPEMVVEAVDRASSLLNK